MKSSLFVSISSLVCTAAILAACSASSIPLSPAPGGAAPAAVRPAAASPCKVKGAWYFHGSCATANLTSKGGTFALAPYRNITISKTIGKNTAVGTEAFVFGDATGAGDVTGKRAGVAFRTYGAKSCAKGFTCSGTAFVYASDINGGDEIALLDATTVTVTDTAGLPGKKRCFPAALTPFGWVPDPSIGVRPTRNSFTITFPADKFFLHSGQTVLTYACE